MNQVQLKPVLNPVATALLIFVVAFLARACWVITLKNDLYWPDERAYVEIARHLTQGDGYISDSYRANPVLPFYLSLVFRLFGENLLLARLGQCVIGGLTCVLIYGIGVELFGGLTGMIAGILFALYPPHIYLSGVFYTECLLLFWSAAAVYVAIRSMPPRGSAPAWGGVATGVALGLAALTRTTVGVWIPCVCFIWLWRAGGSWRAQLPYCAALLLGSAATIIPWTIRNHRAFGAWVPVSSGFGTYLWKANNPFSTGLDHTDWDLSPDSSLWGERLARLPSEQRNTLAAQYNDVEKRIQDLTEQLRDPTLASDRVLGPLAVRYIVSHPLQTAVRSCRRLRLMFSAFSPTVSANEHTIGPYRTVVAVLFYPMLALAICGMALGFSRFREVALLYLLIVSVIATTSLLTATQTRYRLPVDPYLILFASSTLLWLPRRLRVSPQKPRAFEA